MGGMGSQGSSLTAYQAADDFDVLVSWANEQMEESDMLARWGAYFLAPPRKARKAAEGWLPFLAVPRVEMDERLRGTHTSRRRPTAGTFTAWAPSIQPGIARLDFGYILSN